MGTDLIRGFQGIYTNTESNPYLIKPPDANKENAIKYVHYVIDSRDRNISLFPNPSKYEVILFENMQDVRSLKLLAADVPFSRYNIHKHNNVLYLSIGIDPILEITLIEGFYKNERDIVNALRENLDPYNIQLVYNDITKKITFISSSSFSFFFKGFLTKHSNEQDDHIKKTNCMNNVLGFGIKDYTAGFKDDGVYSITSEYPMSLDSDNYIIMKINSADTYVSNSSYANKSFSIINKPSGDLNNNYLEQNIKIFNPPLPFFQRLKISFHDYYGNLYDFNNIDHRIELQFGLIKQGRKLKT